MEDSKLAPTTCDLPPRILDLFLVCINTKLNPASHIVLPYLVTVSGLRDSFLFQVMTQITSPSHLGVTPAHRGVTLLLQAGH